MRKRGRNAAVKEFKTPPKLNDCCRRNHDLRTGNAAAVDIVIGLLYKADAWPSVLLMHTFATFTDDRELSKPRKGHRTRSSVYLVAKGVGLRR
ncbi:hypothetical protein L209DRAFT_572679 [Thermothelomyces heterothallicus CBS 203.75]